jgi:hypothetical protein
MDYDPLFKIHSSVYSLTLKLQESIHAWERTYHQWGNLYISRAHNFLGAHEEERTYRTNILQLYEVKVAMQTSMKCTAWWHTSY